MQTRQLSDGGPDVSELGFGGWALGGGWGQQSDRDSTAALNVAIERGVNLIDTAAVYGDGRSETLVANVLKDRSEHVLVATKTPPSPGVWPPSPYCRWQDRYPAAYLRANIEDRLRNLRTERIDLLQLHTWTRAWNDDPQPLLVLRRMREQGKLNLIGVSTPEHDQNCVVQLMRDGLVDVVQVIFNLFDQEAAAQIFPVAAETGTGVIVRVALDEGSLTGKFSSDHCFAADDFRSRYFSGNRLQRTMDRVDQIATDVQSFGIDNLSMADVSLKFALAHPAVSCVIVGMRDADQVKMNTQAVQKRNLPTELLEQLQRHNWRRGIWYEGQT